MKKFLTTGFLASLLVLFTSCLGEGSSIDERTTYGIAVAHGNSYAPIVYEATGLYVYSEQLSLELREGDCIIYHRSIDLAAQESGTGYYKAAVGDYKILPYTSPVDYFNTDDVLSKEFTTSNLMPKAFLEGRLFVATSHPKIASDQKNNFYTQCSGEADIEDGEHVYNIYLRATERVEGERTKTQNEELSIVDLRELIAIEKNAGRRTMNVKIHYATEFNSESTLVTKWGSFGFPITILED